MVLESLALLRYCWAWFGLSSNDGLLHSFSFLIMLYMAVFSIISIRERQSFWSTRPSNALVISLLLDVLLGTFFALLGISGLIPLLWWQVLFVFGYAMVAGLVVNDLIKILLIKWLIPKANENRI